MRIRVRNSARLAESGLPAPAQTLKKVACLPFGREFQNAGFATSLRKTGSTGPVSSILLAML